MSCLMYYNAIGKWIIDDQITTSNGVSSWCKVELGSDSYDHTYSQFADEFQRGHT